MKIALIAIISVLLLIYLFVRWRYYATEKGRWNIDNALMSQVAPVISIIQSGEPTPTDQILALAKRPDTRSFLFRTLHEIKRPELFPKEYSELWQIAESHLVRWLLHPNELGAVPDEIVLVKEIESSEGDPPQKYRFFVFKFRTSPPQWAAKNGWMAGVAGPYWDGELPLVSPPGVGSCLDSFDSATPEEHFQKLEQLALKVLKRG